MAEDSLLAEDATPATYLHLTRSSPHMSMVHVQNARANDSLTAWQNLAAMKSWIFVGTWPTVSNPKLVGMQSVLQDEVRVTAGVLDQLSQDVHRLD